MASTAIKICGIRTDEALNALIELQCFAAGFIFYPPSPRDITIADAAILAKKAEGHLQTVAVTVNAEDELLDEIVLKVKPNMLQLHGDETPKRVRELKEKYGLPVIKAFKIRESDDIAYSRAFKAEADYLLFDSKAPKDMLPGGNGLVFDWALMENRTFILPWFLSGGLNEENISQALTTCRAPMVDVSSSVESAPGEKNINAIRRFVAAVRKYDTQ